MTPEIVALLGGGVSGFVMKLIAAQAEAQQRSFEMMLKRQGVADDSADRAEARGGVWMRRFIALMVVFAVILVPVIAALAGDGLTVETQKGGFLGLFKGVQWKTLDGFVMLPEIRHALLVILGFYFGSSQVR